MNLLAIDTTGSVCTCALAEEKKLLAELYIDQDRTHSQGLMPMIDTLFRMTGTSLHEVDAFACAVGPGSFTGIRIGVATAKAFAHALDKPVIAVNTLDGLCCNVDYRGLICPMIDARRQEVYTAFYRQQELPQRLSDYSALPLEEVLKQCNEPVMFVGDGAVNYREEIQAKLKERALFAADASIKQRAAGVARAAFLKAKAGQIEDAYRLSPFYLKKPQAQREYESRHG